MSKLSLQAPLEARLVVGAAVRARAASLSGALALALSACGGGSAPSTQVAIVGASQAADDAWSFQATVDGAAAPGVHWTFGDGGSQDGASATHAYAQAGDYTVTATAAGGGQASRTVAVRFASHVAGLPCQGSTGWCWQADTVVAQGLDLPFFLDALRGWAPGPGGVVAKTVDGGLTWRRVDAGVLDDVTSVRFADALHGWAATNGAGLLKTADGGETWQLDAAGDLVAGSYLPPTVVAAGPTLVAISDGRVSLDGGATWARRSPALVSFVAGTDCWSSTGEALLRWAGCAGDAIDGAPSGWRSFSARPVAFTTATHGLIFQSDLSDTWHTDGRVTDDSGVNWQPLAPTGLDGFHAVTLVMPDALHGWLTDPSTGLAHTVDGGHTWAVVVLPTGLQAPRCCSPGASGVFDASTAWVAVARTMAITRDGGVSWQVVAGPPDETRSFVDARVDRWSADGRTIVARFERRVHVSTDGGGTWRRVAGSDPHDLGGAEFGLAAIDARHAVAALGSGTIRHTADGGLTWSRQDDTVGDPSAPLRLAFPTPATGWLMRDHGVRRSADGGATWAPASLPGDLGRVIGMAWPDAQAGYLLDDAGHLYATSDGGATWSLRTLPATPGLPWRDVAFVSGTSGVLIEASGHAARTTDGGFTWTASSTWMGPQFGRMKATADGSVWMLGDTTWRSRDSGATFVLVEGTSFQDVFFVDGDHGWLVDADGLLRSTSDGGATWTATPAGLRIGVGAMAGSDPYTAWIVTSSGEILATAAGGP
jgi:photosystem II stability/assembly factor-like uncharacterized protein